MNTLTTLDYDTIDGLRARLTAEFAAATAAIAASKSTIDAFLASRRDVEIDDEHDPEGSTLALQFSESSALLQNSQRRLDRAVVALGKIADGSYGVCELCAQAIPVARLEARPAAAHCVRCAEVAGL